ncbi:hypothetical protein S2E19_04850 [Bacillus mycoides]|uniref:hypothetical protein n=1 Tax=Bacillus mycoides TaxID=1405 RepID=UPI000A27AC83|nr:hypothetical protein [Bacillus mycoides]MED1038654.1 hypothetical protein [Bacillus mycoides]OSY08015.1 hypothetical protein S2E19_04850 [Bacillus mycoides]
MTISGITMEKYLAASKDAAEKLIHDIDSLTFKQFCNETSKAYEDYRTSVALLAEHQGDNFAIEVQKKMVEKIGESSKIISANELSLNREQFNSFSFIAESLLQIARHGLSVVHGNFTTCRRKFTELRSITKVANPPYDIFDIIWAARNQAMHFDEIKTSPNRNNDTEVHMHEVFKWLSDLKRDEFLEDIKFEPSFFSKFNSGENNLAYQIVQVLGWTSYEKFKSDMDTLS